MSENSSPHRAGENCATSFGVKWSLIDTCFKEHGEEYELQVAATTWKYKRDVTRVPLVVMDGDQDAEPVKWASTSIRKSAEDSWFNENLGTKLDKDFPSHKKKDDKGNQPDLSDSGDEHRNVGVGDNKAGEAGENCATAFGVKWSLIDTCFKEHGEEYELEVAATTWKYKSDVTRVPIVVMNGKQGIIIVIGTSHAQFDTPGISGDPRCREPLF
ncbi:hypothetical protein HPB47_010123 [Ixodes persulcatus]|uniref:Uncharacterized protein n=1 Tax=Ixodes persulcatus TaxID=34615 RepID=A0AC60NZZ3_IXOPE|nr:hypothetical protein HPB47_010123 [Ixodes persulcatus]